MENTKLTKVNLSPPRGQKGAERAPAATPSGSLGSLASLPSSFLGAPSVFPPALSLRAVSRPCAPSSLGSVGRLVPSFALRPLFLPLSAPTATRMTMRGVCRWVAPSLSLSRWGVRSLRSVSPRGVSAFGGLASAWAVALRAALYPVQTLQHSLCAVRGVCRSGGVSNRHNRLAFGSAACVHL